MLKKSLNILIIIGLILIFYNKIDLAKTNIVNKYKITQIEKPNNIYLLKIPKINLTQTFYNEKIDEGIEVVNDKPLILASHSGTANIAYFNKLNKLNKNDEIIIYMNNYQHYKVSDKYVINKTGKLIVKDKTKIYLITCMKNNKQLVIEAKKIG